MSDAGPAPGFQRRPDYPMTIAPFTGRVVVKLAGVEIARTEQALVVKENKYPPAYYLPFADVDDAALVSSDHTTHCPFKGEAVYWTVQANGESIENAMWGYPEPYMESADLAGYVAFYTDKVEQIVQ